MDFDFGQETRTQRPATGHRPQARRGIRANRDSREGSRDHLLLFVWIVVWILWTVESAVDCCILPVVVMEFFYASHTLPQTRYRADLRLATYH